MSLSLHPKPSERNEQAPRLEAEVQLAIKEGEARGSFFAGCVIWFAVSLPFWAGLIWWGFFR